MTACRRVYEYYHLWADCMETAINSGPYAQLQVWDTFTFFTLSFWSILWLIYCTYTGNTGIEGLSIVYQQAERFEFLYVVKLGMGFLLGRCYSASGRLKHQLSHSENLDLNLSVFS